MLSNSSPIYFRLIALWVLCESVLGGIIHGFKLPVSGLIVGSSALICICLIALYVPTKGAILKATIIVAIFKMMLSPQAPLPAYLAVFFQGLMGELLFANRKKYAFGCIALCILGLLESSCQRIIIMTLVYGNSFWKVVNEFSNTLIKSNNVNYSFYVISTYVLLHVAVGIILGIYTAGFPRRIAKWKSNRNYIIIEKGSLIEKTEPHYGVKKKKIKWGLLLVWICLLATYFYSYFSKSYPLLSNSVPQIIIRSSIILLTWYFVVSPILIKLLKSLLTKQQGKFQQDINLIVQLLPSTKYLLKQSWVLSSTKNGLQRMKLFCKIVLVNTLQHEA